MNHKICDNFIRDIERIAFPPADFLALLCGSSLVEDNPRDTDIFIYTIDDESVFARKLFDELSFVDEKANLAYLESLKFYSLKYNSGGIHYSLHIVSVKKLTAFLQNASLIETYTDINVFEVNLYYQTVYRKWILETEYLIGNVALRETLLLKLTQQKKPVISAKQILVSRIKNNISYLKEKMTTDRVTCNVIIGQIFNNLVNYCYLLNDTYYGTVKYIKNDLECFTVDSELCHLTIDIIESLNVISIDKILQKMNCILDHLNKEVRI